jgi:hypothetical protein
MEEDDIIAGGSHPPARVPVSTVKYDVRGEWVIPTLIPMVLFTSKSSHIQGAMTCQLSLLTTIPMAGGNDLAPLL